MNDVPVATNTTTAPNPGVWPTGLLTLASAQGFNSVVIHYETRPACLDSAMDFMADNMTVTLLDESLFVPIVLSSSGAGGSFFTTELTVTNRGSADATLTFGYVPGFGGGGGEGSDVVAAGRQRVVPDAIAYLKSLGNPDSRFREPRRHAARPRLGRAVPRDRPHGADDDGRRGRPGGARLLRDAARGEAERNVLPLRPEAERAGPLQRRAPECGRPVGGRRHAAPDGLLGRSRRAIRHDPSRRDASAGRLDAVQRHPRVERPLARERVRPGRAGERQRALRRLRRHQRPGELRRLLRSRRPVDTAAAPLLLALPALVETPAFSTELVATNWSSSPKTLQLTYVADAIGTADHAAVTTLALGPGEQQILPDFVDRMRQRGRRESARPARRSPGSLFAEATGGDLGGVVLGARVSTPGGGGRFGLFFTAQAVERQTAAALWLFGLQQNAETRSNLALVNLGQPGDPPDVFDIELYDGVTGARAGDALRSLSRAPGMEAVQRDPVLERAGRDGGVRARRADLGDEPVHRLRSPQRRRRPGERTGDGAFVWAVP